MNNTNDIINKMLGPSKGNFECDNAFGKGGMGSKGLGKGFGLGQGQGPLRQGFRNNATNFNINPQHVVEEIRKLLDKLPEVKNAKGTINVTFADGKTSTLNLSYN